MAESGMSFEVTIHYKSWFSSLILLSLEEKGLFSSLLFIAAEKGTATIPFRFARAEIQNTRRLKNRLRALEEHGLLTWDEEQIQFTVLEETSRWYHIGLPRWWGSDVIASIRKPRANPDARVPLTREVRKLVIERDEMVCGLCRLPVEDHKQLHIDHIIPISKGGTNDPDNLQVAHAVCNLRKGARVEA